MKFIPRRDLWLSLIIWLSVIALIVVGLLPFFNNSVNTTSAIITFLVCLAAAAFTAWLWIATYYVIKETELFIRSGPASKSIPFDSITKATPTRSYLASMATSSRRIEITYGKYDLVYISPLDQETFMKELKLRCPHASIDLGSSK